MLEFELEFEPSFGLELGFGWELGFELGFELELGGCWLPRRLPSCLAGSLESMISQTPTRLALVST